MTNASSILDKMGKKFYDFFSVELNGRPKVVWNEYCQIDDKKRYENLTTTSDCSVH